MLRPSAPDTFFFLESPGTLTFERDASGAVAAVTVSGLGGQPLRLVRQEEETGNREQPPRSFPPAQHEAATAAGDRPRLSSFIYREMRRLAG